MNYGGNETENFCSGFQSVSKNLLEWYSSKIKMNPKLLSFAALFFLVFAVNAQNYGLRLIGKVKIPSDQDSSRLEVLGFSLGYVDENSGTFETTIDVHCATPLFPDS